MRRDLRAEPGVRAGRWLVIVLVAVFVTFLAATVLAQVRQAAVDRRVEDILNNSMPSVQHLSAARTALSRLRIDTASYARSLGHDVTRSALLADRRWMSRELDRYLALPFDPGERDLHPPLGDGLASVDAILAEIEDRVDARDASADALLPSFGREAELTDAVIEKLVQLNARVGMAQARSVDHLRLEAVRAAVLIDGMTVGLVIVAVALAVRALQRTVRLLDDQRALAESRADALAERADELGHFGGRVAHDVLSPLASVALALDLAKLRSGDDKTQMMVERGLASLGRVRRIVDGLLEFARAGAPPDGTARSSVVDVVRDVVDGARGEADAAGVTLSVGPVAPVSVACSAGVLTSLVANLVRNAIKYIGDGTRRVTVRAWSSATRCHVEVEDTGPGVPPELRDSLFELYVRANSSRPGIGLGLATVKRLAQAHQGAVGVTSRPGEGSRFWFELPRA